MPKRLLSSSGPKLPFLTDRAFEQEAAMLLAEYGKKYGEVVAPPIPIDEIVELHFGLTLEFHDMQKLFGVPDVHGALWVNEKRVGIDHRLDPSENPPMLGRYNFTLAHEAGHWRLHRQLFQRNANQVSLFAEGVERPEYICRSSDTEPIEYQANRFASCLLMPCDIVKQAWEEWRGALEPVYLPDLRAENTEGVTDELLMENAVRPFAVTFHVSAEAMRIRAEQMGLLLRKRESLLF